MRYSLIECLKNGWSFGTHCRAQRQVGPEACGSDASNIYPAPQDVVFGLDRPRALGVGLSGVQHILTQDPGYQFPGNQFVGKLVNKGQLLKEPGCLEPGSLHLR